MTDTSWTPGPWTLDEDTFDEAWGPTITGPGRFIAAVHDIGDEQQAANARLIAAAPEMAELLRAWALAFDIGEGDIMTADKTRELLDRIYAPASASPS